MHGLPSSEREAHAEKCRRPLHGVLKSGLLQPTFGTLFHPQFWTPDH
jgi:hypothetical protein